MIHPLRVSILFFLFAIVYCNSFAQFLGSALYGTKSKPETFTITLVQYWKTLDNPISEKTYGALFEDGEKYALKNIDLILDTLYIESVRNPVTCAKSENLNFHVYVFRAEVEITNAEKFYFVWQNKLLPIEKVTNCTDENIFYSHVLPLRKIGSNEDLLHSLMPPLFLCSHQNNSFKIIDKIVETDITFEPVVSIIASEPQKRTVIPNSFSADDPLKKYPVDAPPYRGINGKSGYEKSLPIETRSTYNADKYGMVQLEPEVTGRFIWQISCGLSQNMIYQNTYSFILTTKIF